MIFASFNNLKLSGCSNFFYNRQVAEMTDIISSKLASKRADMLPHVLLNACTATTVRGNLKGERAALTLDN